MIDAERHDVAELLRATHVRADVAVAIDAEIVGDRCQPSLSAMLRVTRRARRRGFLIRGMHHRAVASLAAQVGHAEERLVAGLAIVGQRLAVRAGYARM